MSLLDDLKKVATDSLSKTIQDSISNNIGGVNINDHLPQITPIITDLLSQQGSVGGLTNLITLFNNVNLGNIIQSWINNGANLPISLQQIKSVLGETWLETYANKLGINPMLLSGIISQLLPLIIDRVTPEGNISTENITEQFDIAKLLTSIINKGVIYEFV